MSALISVVTLTHDKLEYSRICLTSLLRTEYSPWELIVVDNGSTDGTREWLAELTTLAADHGVAVRVIENDDNVGCSTARNQGFAASRGSRVAFVDNDVALRDVNWLTRMGDVLDSAADIGMVGPKLVYPTPPHRIQFAGGAVTPSGRVVFLGRGEARDDARFATPFDMQCCISACWMLKRSVIDEIGDFDEAFNPVEYEDIDLSYRLRDRGYRIRYCPDVEMYHFENVTTTGTPKLPNTYLIVKNGMLFKKRWQHMFTTEAGPPDVAAKWRDVPPSRLSDIADLPLVGQGATKQKGADHGNGY